MCSLFTQQTDTCTYKFTVSHISIPLKTVNQCVQWNLHNADTTGTSENGLIIEGVLNS